MKPVPVETRDILQATDAVQAAAADEQQCRAAAAEAYRIFTEKRQLLEQARSRYFDAQTALQKILVPDRETGEPFESMHVRGY